MQIYSIQQHGLVSHVYIVAAESSEQAAELVLQFEVEVEGNETELKHGRTAVLEASTPGVIEVYDLGDMW